MKTFDEYNKQIAFTVAQNNGHCDPLWAWLECAGELGEVLDVLITESLGPIGQADSFGVSLLSDLVETLDMLRLLEKRKKKFRRDQAKPLRELCQSSDPPQITPTPELLKELGGILWGLNQLCNQCGTSLEEVADVNYRELRDRFDKNPEWLLSKGAES
jgi:hypothetical protein